MTDSLTIMTSPLTMDSLQIENLRQEYDYDSQKVKPGSSYFDLLREALRNFIDSIFGSNTYAENQQLIWSLIAIAIVIAIVAVIMIKRPDLFFSRKSRGDKMEYTVSEDTIYGIDFDTEITRAAGNGNYREAIRLTYLKTLRLLSDREIIDWQPFKTPSQYTREFQNEKLRIMTNHFLRVRYGDFDADKDLFATVCSLADGIAGTINENKLNDTP